MSKIPARLLAIFFLLLAGSIWIVSRLLDGSTILLDTFSECFTIAGRISVSFRHFLDPHHRLDLTLTNNQAGKQ